MGTDNIFHKKKSLKSRIMDTRRTKKIILIVCEGEKTEPNYFRSFKLPTAQVETIIVGEGFNTISLIDSALKKKKNIEMEIGIDVESVWCVFDRDSFPSYNFTNAISKAEANNINVAYSNEAFELWYLLHFEFVVSGMTRQLLVEKLTKNMNEKYKKNDCSMYEKILGRQSQAINNAEKLLKFHDDNGGIFPQNNNPSTTVHKLVEFLNSEMEI